MGALFRGLGIGLCAVWAAACSFDYEELQGENESVPDITMERLEWVRVRGGDPQVKLEAELGERYEKKHIMELKNYVFLQYDTSRGGVDSAGSGGMAKIELESGNIKMTETVLINVDSEDIKLDAEDLEWRDKERALSSGPYTRVHIAQENGTDFSGAGFSANTRSRTWLFSAGASGDYYFDEDDEDAPASAAGSPASPPEPPRQTPQSPQ